MKGVAPDVRFHAYRVFGCEGSTTSDIMLAAMERVLDDGADVLNMSIGAAFQWPQYPTAQAAEPSRRGAASSSWRRSGTAARSACTRHGAPGVGRDVIGVASFDNTHANLPAFTVSPDATAIGYIAAAGAPPPPTTGTFPMARTGTATTTNDACAALPAGSLTGKVALIRRGTCSFYVKAFNAQTAGAAGVVLYNNVAGFISPTVAGDAANHDSGRGDHGGQGRVDRRPDRERPGDDDVDEPGRERAESDRRIDLELLVLRPAARSELQAGHRRAGRHGAIHASARAGRIRRHQRHLDGVATRRRAPSP